MVSDSICGGNGAANAKGREMRWLYVDPKDLEEHACRQAQLKRIKSWWTEFASNAVQIPEWLQSGACQHLMDWMQCHLMAVDSRLKWEFGPARKGPGYRLVVTPEAERQLRPLVSVILSHAPQLPGWEFYDYRLPEPLDHAISVVKGVCGGDITCSLAEPRIEPTGGISITYHCPSCEGVDEEMARMAACVATEALLGEETLERWIGGIRVVHDLAKRGECGKRSGDSLTRAIPLARLQPTVEALIGSIVDQLPSEPCHRYLRDEGWSVYEMQPQKNSDYARRDDLLVAVTGRPDVFERAHGDGVFHSNTLSRCGETFAYLKFDSPLGLDVGQRFKERGELEDAVDALLKGHRFGCVVGGGTGLRYSYIDLALTNVPAACDLLRPMLKARKAPAKSWVLFFDHELGDEWIPIYSEAPPPPK